MEIEIVEGYSIDEDDMHWTVNCPDCDKEYEYEGYFDSSDITKCRCGCEFKTACVWVTENEYIK
ncbi:MAG: hypothetical protein ABIN04_15230 [Ginsengibacter sp.]